MSTSMKSIIVYKQQLLKLVIKSLTSTTNVKVGISLMVKKSYNKMVTMCIDFNFGRHEGISALKNDTHLGRTFSGR